MTAIHRAEARRAWRATLHRIDSERRTTMTAREWLRLHDLTHHALVPLWRAIPKRRRWDVVHLLNRSARTCWCDLVDAALSDNEPDPCDSALPLGSASLECRTHCKWTDHGTEGHECACYCGKFGPTGAFPFVRAGDTVVTNIRDALPSIGKMHP